MHTHKSPGLYRKAFITGEGKVLWSGIGDVRIWGVPSWKSFTKFLTELAGSGGCGQACTMDPPPLPGSASPRNVALSMRQPAAYTAPSHTLSPKAFQRCLQRHVAVVWSKIPPINLEKKPLNQTQLFPTHSVVLTRCADGQMSALLPWQLA